MGWIIKIKARMNNPLLFDLVKWPLSWSAWNFIIPWDPRINGQDQYNWIMIDCFVMWSGQITATYFVLFTADHRGDLTCEVIMIRRHVSKVRTPLASASKKVTGSSNFEGGKRHLRNFCLLLLKERRRKKCRWTVNETVHDRRNIRGKPYDDANFQ